MKGLPRKRQLAIAALLTHRSVAEPARSIGVGESTLFRWLQNQTFQRVLREAKRQMVQHVITKIQHAACDAVETLREIVRDPEKPASARATAARTIIDMAMKGLEYEDLLSRIEALEEYIGERK